MSRFPTKTAVVLIFVVGLALRLGFAEYALRNIHERMPDSEIYLAYADDIFHGREYKVGDSRALRTPGYPAFLAACWWLAGEPSRRPVLLAQAILGTLTAALGFVIGQSFERTGAPKGMALAAATLLLFEPYGLLLGVLELSETLFTTALVACAWLARRWMLRGSLVDASCFGVLAGSGVLVRPSALLLPPLCGLLAITVCRDRKAMLSRLSIAALLMIATLAPWWVRNAAVYGSPVWTTLNVGESLYDAWNPKATGASDMWFQSRESIESMSEVDRDIHWRNAAIAYARANPSRAITLAWHKLGRFWSPWPNDPRFRTPAVVFVTTFASVTIYTLAVVGLLAALLNCWNTRPLAWIVLPPVVYFCLLHAIFVSSVRYRVPTLPLLVLAAGLGLAAINQRLTNRSGSSRGPA